MKKLTKILYLIPVIICIAMFIIFIVYLSNSNSKKEKEIEDINSRIMAAVDQEEKYQNHRVLTNTKPEKFTYEHYYTDNKLASETLEQYDFYYVYILNSSSQLKLYIIRMDSKTKEIKWCEEVYNYDV